MGIRRTGAWTPSRHLSPPPQEQSGAPTTARPRPQRGPRQPTQWTGSRGKRSARPRTPHATVEGTPPGTPCHRPHNPKPSRGEPGPDRPPPSTPDGARDRCRTRGGARTTWNGPTSAQCRDHARCARHTTQGADTARARAHTHEKDTRGPPEGQPDRARGTHRPHGMAYQRARIRDTRTGRARHTQRGTRGAGRGGKGRHNTRYRPEPPRTGRERRAHRDRTLHPTRQ